MYKYWKKNKRQLEMTICYLNRFQVDGLRKGKKLNEISLDNLYSKLNLVLWMSLLEVEFNILISENEQFTNDFVGANNITNKTETEKWIELIKYYFKKNYFKRQDREISLINLGDTNYHRFEVLTKTIEQDLKPFMEMRNRIAHGQWAVAFNSICTEQNRGITKYIWTLSKKEMMLVKAFVKNLPPLIKLLITSKETFERDYDRYIYRLIKAKTDADLKYNWIAKK